MNNKTFKIYLLVTFCMVFTQCNLKEPSDEVPHIMDFVEGKETIRMDYYEAEKGMLIVYFTDYYKNERIFIQKYSELLLKAKEKWNFSTIDYDVFPEQYNTQEFID